MNAIMESEAAKSVQAASMISACEDHLARFRATINVGKTSSTGAATSAIVESSAAPSTRSAPIGPQFKRRPLPTFKSGELRDYPTFKSDWARAVDGYFKPSEERRAIRDCMPEDIRPDIERMRTMEEIWKLLDNEYGKPNKLSAERVAYLYTYQYPKTATTEAAKFKELYRCWSTIYSDLAKVNQLDALNHAPMLKTFLGKLPSKASGQRYITMASELRIKKKSELEIIATFMTAERQTQKQQEELFGSVKEAPKEPGAKDGCHGCEQAGHKAAQCPCKTSHSTKTTHSTTQKPLRPCPACGGTHTATGTNNKTYYKTCLSSCEAFTSKSVDERATIIQQARGCILCLDWTGSHQVRACQAKGRQRKMFDPCKQLINGLPCGKRHNHLLHGSGNSYCYARTRAKVGSKCAPKVLAKTKPEQKDSGKEPSVEEEQAKEAALR